MRFKHQIILFLVYFVLFITLTSLIDYYAYDIINPWIFITISFFAALVATFIHIKNRQKSKVDEIVDEIEEIL